MTQVTWLGDADQSVQQITQYGHTFVKGEPTDVPARDPKMAKFKGNAFFHVEGEDAADGEQAPKPKANAKRKPRARKAPAKQLADAQAALPEQKAEGTAQ